MSSQRQNTSLFEFSVNLIFVANSFNISTSHQESVQFRSSEFDYSQLTKLRVDAAQFELANQLEGRLFDHIPSEEL